VRERETRNAGRVDPIDNDRNVYSISDTRMDKAGPTVPHTKMKGNTQDYLLSPANVSSPAFAGSSHGAVVSLPAQVVPLVARAVKGSFSFNGGVSEPASATVNPFFEGCLMD
jgi:hypothetical protein